MLPIAAYRQSIIEMLEMSQVIVLSGETGWYALRSNELDSFLVLIQFWAVESLLNFQASYSRISCPEVDLAK